MTQGVDRSVGDRGAVVNMSELDLGYRLLIAELNGG